ncbi:MAG TPA: histidine kinase [Solirubrobacterales bacterium]|jgi:signal transduction histidine kinase
MTEDSDPARLRRLLAEQAALRRVATMVAQDTPASTLFHRVCVELGRLLDVLSTDVIRYDDDGMATVVGVWSARDEPTFPVGERIPIDPNTVTGKIHRTGKPQRVDDYSKVEGELAQRLRERSMLSVVGAPIVVSGRIWGGIMVVSSTPNGFEPGVEDRVAGFAELVTAALANADAREKLAASRARIVAAADAARRRIERDLHDGAQQRLISLALRLELLQRRVEPETELARELAEVRAELSDTLTELRELARGIHPSVLSERGLRAALEALAGNAPMAVDLAVANEATEAPSALQMTAYFIVAEALTNATKHAQAERASVNVTLADDVLAVEVADDGRGGADANSGTGLRGLADRVNALDGEFEIESRPGNGTTVRARMPLEACEGLEDEVPVAAGQA